MINRLRKAWKREQERRAQRRAGRDRVAEAEGLIAAQTAGTISPEESSRRFDDMLFRDTGTLVYFGDSTGLVADWDPDVIIFHADGSTQAAPIASNTGIYARGEKRGWIVRKADTGRPEPTAQMLEHFGQGSKGRIEL